jgi:hypothetical protein
MSAVTVAAIRETVPGERRVALTPESAARLRDGMYFADAKEGLARLAAAVKVLVG